MIRLGITGQNGFIGQYLFNTINLLKNEFTIIQFNRDYFNNQDDLDAFVNNCDVIVHLAALNRHNDPQVIFDTNVSLVKKLIDSFNRTKVTPHVIISSSTQEVRDNIYGKSKREARTLLASWAESSNAIFTGMLIPNVFGPFGQPYYNSVVATFCHQVARNETPKIEVDSELKLIYVSELVEDIISSIRNKYHNTEYHVTHTTETKVSDILNLILKFKNQYQDNGEIPALINAYEHNLFNTFKCHIDIKNFFPKKLTQHIDDRGAFVEIVRLGIGGQVSFSTTLPGITRGNHYHTRKIERFAVIKGKALIQLRRIGTKEVYDFYLDGDEPAFVDMPIWYTHNIKNIGDEVLYTNFWINEPFDPKNPDTYFETV